MKDGLLFLFDVDGVLFQNYFLNSFSNIVQYLLRANTFAPLPCSPDEFYLKVFDLNDKVRVRRQLYSGLRPDGSAYTGEHYLRDVNNALREIYEMSTGFSSVDQMYHMLYSDRLLTNKSIAQGITRLISKLMHGNRDICNVGLLSDRRTGDRTSVKFILQTLYEDIFDASDTSIFSYELGLSKLEGGIYSILPSYTGYPFDQIVFIDDRNKNVLRARSYGIQAERWHNSLPVSVLENLLMKYLLH